MRQARWVLCAILLSLSTPVNSSGEPSPFGVRLLRAEGAAAGVRRSAERVADIAKKISDSGRLGQLPALHTELTDLHRMVVGSRMAVDMAIKDMESSQVTN